MKYIAHVDHFWLNKEDCHYFFYWLLDICLLRRIRKGRNLTSQEVPSSCFYRSGTRRSDDSYHFGVSSER
jgi:hypothetical protein